MFRDSSWRTEHYEKAYQYLDSIESMKMTALFIDKPMSPKSNFVIDVQDVSFPNLKSLTLKKSNIHSIEKMQYWDMPNLTGLSLIKNNIANVYSLIKVNGAKIWDFQIDDDATMEVEELYKGNFIKTLKSMAKKDRAKLKKFANKP